MVNHLPFAIGHKRGFSLIEVLIASALLMVAVVVFLSGWFGANVNTSVNRSAIASQIALRKMEELRGTPFLSLPSSGSFSDPNLAKLPSATTTITVQDYLATSTMKHIFIIVSWRDGAAPKSYRIDSVFTSGGTNPP